jgi:hypothetical protein
MMEQPDERTQWEEAQMKKSSPRLKTQSHDGDVAAHAEEQGSRA